MKNILKEIRKKYNLTQIDLAKNLGVSRGVVAQIEVGNNKITGDLAIKIAELYGLTVEFILNYNGQYLEYSLKPSDVNEEKTISNTQLIYDNLDNFINLKNLVSAFCSDKGLKGATPLYDRFEKQVNFTSLIIEFDEKLSNKSLDHNFENFFYLKLNQATELLHKDLLNNMYIAYKIIDSKYM